MEPPRAVLRGAAWLAAGYLARTAAYVVLTIVAARVLGADDYGRLSLFLALATGVAYLAGSWPFLALPILSAEGRQLRHLFPVALALGLLPAAGMAVLAAALAPSLAPAADTSVAAVAVYGIALVVLQAAYGVLQTHDRMMAIAVAQAAERGAAAACVLLLALVTSPDVQGVTWVLSGTAAVAAIVTLSFAGRREALFSALSARVAGRTGAEVVRRVGPMAIVAACSYLVAWMDILILSAFRPPEEVGQYGLAYQVFTALLQLASLWVVAALPARARAQAAAVAPGREVADDLRGGVALWGAACAGVGLFVTLGFDLTFGDEYAPAKGPLLALLASAAWLGPYFAGVPSLLTTGRARALMIVSLGGVAINLVGDLALVERFGFWAPAVATAAQNVVVSTAVMLLVGGGALLVGLARPLSVPTVALAVAAVDPGTWWSTGAVAVALALLLAWGASDIRGLRPRPAPCTSR